MNKTVKETDVAEKRPVHKTINEALVAAQMEMGKALKASENPHFRSKYADLGSVMDACLPALNKHGICVAQPVKSSEAGSYVTTRLIHESGEALECDVPLLMQRNDMQAFGSAMTYARRYGLMAMAGIAPEDDDGTGAGRAPEFNARAVADRMITDIRKASELSELAALWSAFVDDLRRIRSGDQAAAAEVEREKDRRKADLTPNADLSGDEIPY